MILEILSFIITVIMLLTIFIFGLIVIYLTVVGIVSTYDELDDDKEEELKEEI